MSDEFRASYLAQLCSGRKATGLHYSERVDQALESWAAQLETELDIEQMLSIASDTQG